MDDEACFTRTQTPRTLTLSPRGEARGIGRRRDFGATRWRSFVPSAGGKDPPIRFCETNPIFFDDETAFNKQSYKVLCDKQVGKIFGFVLENEPNFEGYLVASEGENAENGAGFWAAGRTTTLTLWGMSQWNRWRCWLLEDYWCSGRCFDKLSMTDRKNKEMIHNSRMETTASGALAVQMQLKETHTGVFLRGNSFRILAMKVAG